MPPPIPVCGERVIYQQPAPRLCADTLVLVSVVTMSADRIASALTRIEAAMARIDAARDGLAIGDGKAGSSSARVVELVNVHEKLREQIAESLRELDELLTTLEE